MKTVIYYLLTIVSVIIILFMLGRENSKASELTPENPEYPYEFDGTVWNSVEYKILEYRIDSCEYIIIIGVEGRNIIHKANCDNEFHLNR